MNHKVFSNIYFIINNFQYGVWVILKLTAELRIHENQLDILQTVKSEFVHSQNMCYYGSTEQFGYHYTLCPDEAKAIFKSLKTLYRKMHRFLYILWKSQQS